MGVSVIRSLVYRSLYRLPASQVRVGFGEALDTAPTQCNDIPVIVCYLVRAATLRNHYTLSPQTLNRKLDVKKGPTKLSQEWPLHPKLPLNERSYKTISRNGKPQLLLCVDSALDGYDRSAAWVCREGSFSWVSQNYGYF